MHNCSASHLLFSLLLTSPLPTYQSGRGLLCAVAAPSTHRRRAPARGGGGGPPRTPGGRRRLGDLLCLPPAPGQPRSQGAGSTMGGWWAWSAVERGGRRCGGRPAARKAGPPSSLALASPCPKLASPRSPFTWAPPCPPPNNRAVSSRHSRRPTAAVRRQQTTARAAAVPASSLR